MSRVDGPSTSGPIPYRSTNLSRERDALVGGKQQITTGVLRPVKKPRASSEWHRTCKMLWEAAGSSGMADYYQNSDWALLYSLLDDLNDQKRSAEREYKDERGQISYGRVNGQVLAVIYSTMTTLGFTEGDRRRMRVELTAPDTEDKNADVTAINEYKRMLKVAK